MKAFGDPEIDVRSSGVVGWPSVRTVMEECFKQTLSERWVRKLAKRDPTLRFVGRCPGTTVERVRAHCAAHVTSEQASPRNAAMARWERLETLVATSNAPRCANVGHRVERFEA
jgi:hypothetical protein